MKLSVSDEAKKIINVHRDDGMIPTICLEQGGCAGTTLTLKVMLKTNDLLIIDNIAISNDVTKITNDIIIDVKGGLCRNIVVLNNDAKIKCRCGKSFLKK